MSLILKNIIYLNFVVGVSSGLLTAGFSKMLGIPNWWIYGLFGFFSTMAVYNGQRLFKASISQKTPWLLWVTEHKTFILGLTVLCGLTAGVFLLNVMEVNLLTTVVLLLSSVISVLYVLKIRGKNMRELPYLKIHLIAFTWVGVLILFPMLNSEHNDHLVLNAMSHYCYVLAVAIPFDIRDLKYDAKQQKTIPQTIGILYSKVLGIVLLLLFGSIMLYMYPLLRFNAIFFLAILIQALLIAFMNESKSDLYCAGAIDGAIGLLGLSYLF